MTDTTIITRQSVAASNPTAPAEIPAWLSPDTATETAATAGSGSVATVCGGCHQRVICLCRQRELEADAQRETRVWYVLGASALVAISYALFQFLNSH